MRHSLVVLITCALATSSCQRGPWKVGGVYSLSAEPFQEGFHVLKVVSLDDDSGCALLYERLYAERPTAANCRDRGLQDRLVPARLLLEEDTFDAATMGLVAREPVTDAEVALCVAERSQAEEKLRSALLAGVEGRDAATEIDFSGGRPTSVPDDLVLGLEWTKCFGTCPAYRLTIDAKGHVIYEGLEHVQLIGKATGDIDLEELHELVAAYCAARLFPRNDYRHCEMEATCMASAILTIRANGHEKRIERYMGCLNVPEAEELDALANLVDDVTRSGRWTSTPPP